MSKTIGNMTLKAAPVGTDMVAIADSEDLDRTKKVLLSALGGASNVHIVTDITISNGHYSGSSSDVTQYEVGHLYILVRDEYNYDSSTSKYISINSISEAPFYFNADSNFSDGSYPANALPGKPEITIVIYGNDNAFHLVTNTWNDIKKQLWVTTLHMGSTSLISSNSTNVYAYVKQIELSNNNSDVSIAYNNSSYRHSIVKCTTPLTSLTISNATSSNSMPELEKEIQFTTAATFTFTATDLVGKWLGVAAPTFDPNTSYVVAIKNGYATYSKVGA